MPTALRATGSATLPARCAPRRCPRGDRRKLRVAAGFRSTIANWISGGKNAKQHRNEDCTRPSALTAEEPPSSSPNPAGNKLNDPYRSFIFDDLDINWRNGGPPNYVRVNKMFEQQRTQQWPDGSLEQVVENLVKSWEAELSHKADLEDFKSIDHKSFSFEANGLPAISAEELNVKGSYNALMATTLPNGHEGYKASEETFESSHDIFRTAFPKGFAWEVLQVYSGPPVVAMKYRHWGIMEGPYKGYKPTGKVVESVGICIATVNDDLSIRGLEVYYDPTVFLGSLMQGEKVEDYEYARGTGGKCPVLGIMQQ